MGNPARIISLAEWDKSSPVTKYSWLQNGDYMKLGDVALLLQRVQDALGATGMDDWAHN